MTKKILLQIERNLDDDNLSFITHQLSSIECMSLINYLQHITKTIENDFYSDESFGKLDYNNED